MDFPDFVIADFKQSKNRPMSLQQGFYPVGDIASKWLTKNLGLNTSDNYHKFDGVELSFNWVSQKWRVKYED